MFKRIVFMSITGIIFLSLLTGCSYVGKFFTETYYVKIEGQGTKERDAVQYTLKGFKENGEEKTIQFITNSDKQIKEGTYLKIKADEDKGANKKTPDKISLINGYEEVKSEDVPEKIKEKLK
ncbi:TPA: YxeA family protein [Bacillus cereus]